MGHAEKKRVASNTLIMYARLLFVTCLALYTSRILLEILGISDYGVYSVVGSISATFVAVKSFFSESIQRFLNVAKGKGKDGLWEQVQIFNMSFIIHIVLAILFLLIVEPIGIWMVHYKLEIPLDRLDTATFVFHMTIVATVLGIVSIPYDALIITNEKMGFYAIVSVFDGLLRLICILIIPYIANDYLRTYSLLLIIIPLSTLVLQIFYCRQFRECRYSFHLNISLMRDVFVFSSWNFMGNICFSLIHEGINFIINIFGGVTANASRSIAYQIKNAMNQMSANAIIAVRPLVMQRSIQTTREDYFGIIFEISRLSFFLNIIPIVPMYVYCPEIIKIWLIEAPDNVVLFTRLILISLLIRSLHEPINIMNMAFGTIKRMMIIESLVMTLFLIIIYFVMRLLSYVWMPFVILPFMEISVLSSLLLNARQEVGLPVFLYFKVVIAPLLLLLIISGLLVYVFEGCLDNQSLLWVFGGIGLVTLLEIVLCSFFFNSTEKNIVSILLKRTK